jgi:hypothetical protein
MQIEQPLMPYAIGFEGGELFSPQIEFGAHLSIAFDPRLAS